MALLTYEQQTAIRSISANNQRRYPQIESEVEDVYLPRLLGFKLAQLVQTTPNDYASLLNGSSFVYCDETYTHKGLRYCLAYYIYAEYINQSDFEDSFTGLVRQNRGESEHLSGGRIGQLRDYYIKIADTAFEMVKKYIISAELDQLDTPTMKATTPKMVLISNEKAPERRRCND